MEDTEGKADKHDTRRVIALAEASMECVKKCLKYVLLISLISATLHAQTKSIPILVYHRFSSVKTGSTTVRTSAFEAQLQWLSDHQYQVLPLRSVLATLRNPDGIFERPSVEITADDGDESLYTDMYPLLLRYKVPVTLFIFPSAISRAHTYLKWDQLQEMQASGLVDIQSHTYWHPNFRVERARLSTSAYRTFVEFQLRQSKRVLEHKLKVRVQSLAWPYGIFDPDLESMASQDGYQAAFAFSGGLAAAGCNLFAIPRIPVTGALTGANFGALLAGSRAQREKK